MSPPKPLLYSYWRSSCSWRVRMVLNLKEIDYDYKAIHLVKGEQKSDDYLKVCAAGQVPALVINGETLSQSMAIMNYLEELYPDKPILPKSPVERAQVRMVAEMIACGIQPVQNLSVLQAVNAGGMDKMAWGHITIQNGFEALELVLAKTSGDFCVGDSFTMADACLVPQIYNANRFKVDMTKFPLISKIGENCDKLPFVKAAHPSRQPDTPEEAKATS